jgi:hypothetical protein
MGQRREENKEEADNVNSANHGPLSMIGYEEEIRQGPLLAISIQRSSISKVADAVLQNRVS